MLTPMKIGILGTGAVGQALAKRLQALGHNVFIGTRNPATTSTRNDLDYLGNPPFKVWHEQHKAIPLGTYAQAAAHGAMVINATSGVGSLDALRAAGEPNLAGKVLVDVSNPLDFSKGMPPSLSVSNTDSLGEQIQRAFPSVKLVKTLNTMTIALMVGPESFKGGDHTCFVAGNDAAAKQTATEMLKSFGWRDIFDLGDVTSCRGSEAYMMFWFRLYSAGQTPMFNVKVIR